MRRITRKFKIIFALLVVIGMHAGTLTAIAQTMDSSSYYTLTSSMSPQLMSGAGQSLLGQIQAANGNLAIINSAFQNAIQYAIQTNDPASAQQVFNLYQNFLRPIMESQHNLTDSSNPNNLANLNGTLQNGLAPVLNQLNTVLTNNSTSYGGQITGFNATPQSAQQLVQVFNQLLALQGNQTAQTQLGNQFNSGLNYADMAQGNFNILNVIQGVRTLTADNTTGAQQAGGAAAIINSLGLDPNVAGPLGTIAGMLFQNNQTSTNLGTNLGGINSGLPQVTSMVGNMIGSMLGGGSASQVGGQVRDFVTSQMMSGITRSLGSNNQAIQLPAGLNAATQALQGNVAGAVTSAAGLASNLSTGVANTPGANAAAAVAAGASPSPAADAARSAAGGGGASSCPANGGGAGTGGAPGGAKTPGDTQSVRDYLIENSGETPAQVDAFIQQEGLDPNASANGSWYPPTGGATGGGGAGAGGTASNVGQGDATSGFAEANPDAVAAANRQPITTDNQDLPLTRETTGAYLRRMGQSQADIDSYVAAGGSLTTPATQEFNLPAQTDAQGNGIVDWSGHQGTQSPAGTTVANTGGTANNTGARTNTRSNQIGNQVFQQVFGGIMQQIQTGQQRTNATNATNNAYAQQPATVQPPITQQTLEAQLRAEFLRQLMLASTTPINQGTNLNGTVSLLPAKSGNLTQAVANSSSFLSNITNYADNLGRNSLGLGNTELGSAIQGGLGSLINGGGIKDIATAVGTASIGGAIGGEMLNKALADSPVLNSMLGGIGGGGKGVPVQVQKGAYYSMVENNLKEILKTNKKQLDCDIANYKIQAEFRKAKFVDDPAGYDKATKAAADADKQTQKFAEGNIATDWGAWVREMIGKYLEKTTKAVAENDKICSPLKDSLQKVTTAVTEVASGPNAAWVKSLSCTLSEEQLAKVATTGQLPDGDEGLLLFAMANDSNNTKLGLTNKMLNKVWAEQNRAEKIELAKLTASGGFKDETKKKDAAPNPQGKQKTDPDKLGEEIKRPGSTIAGLYETSLDRPTNQSSLNANTKEESLIIAPQVSQNIQRITGSEGTPAPRNQTGQNNSGGTDWLKYFQLGAQLYCAIDPGSGICGGGGNNNQPPPQPQPPVVVPQLEMMTATTTVGSMLGSGITWAGQGVTSCVYNTDWISFGNTATAATTPSVIFANGSTAELAKTLFVYQPHVFRLEVAISPKDSTQAPPQVTQYKTRLQKVYPANGTTNKTALIQETAYVPNVVGLTGNFDIVVKLGDAQMTISDLPTSEATPMNIASAISRNISSSMLIQDSAIKQYVTEHNLVFVALDNKLTVHGMQIVDGQIPDSANYGLSCTGNNGSPLSKSVNIRFSNDRIE
ncbi:MAG: hypothetical protein WC764_02375 [Candidatus Paceibacterota bacterium]|jgi:hypothetical protein